MARPVDTRDNYEKDAQVILRVLQAVQKDDTHATDWRDRTADSLRLSISLLLNPKAGKTRARKTA